ncbi:hypothetical protein CE91St62_03030 [Lachnospiraceae bacterium]|uniref:DUF305 domain-containing protein n=1 Tax=Extibacter sp. GGCC_0201 TaxID=2731209 RepID=UPI001AA16F89|nr:DUF305 domain-containing protein [Extibacter sp. GGCC_0201]MBO1720254.1 DUF305 domain-containing protein [Extibacter sp. GGCC_0201]BDF32232.1 hypothetical protein CE91St61_03070 [Lachnospiraceae bacterium]BDF36242.1 hypothetical protein CE91St62_03030 [Lachnospiraceae bacterium]
MNMCRFSNNTRDYVEQYHCILDEMIRNMNCAELTDSLSGSFITQMIPHHRAAIEMSKNLLCYTTNIPLQDIALNIISSQEKSIQNMTEVFPRCESCINCKRDIECYEMKNERIISDMIYEMKSACTDNHINCNFMREMIPHHRGAVRMSENALRFSLCPELVPLLDAIIVSQKEGIRKMQCLMKKAGC